MDRQYLAHSPGDEVQAPVQNEPPRPRSHRPRLFAFAALVAVVGLFDLIYLVRSLSQPVRPGDFAQLPPHLPHRLSREEILDEVRLMVGIQNLALTVTLLGGDWVLRTWRKGSARPFTIFVALGLLPFALGAVICFIGMLHIIVGLRV
jgi:hypothetical protein